MTNKKTKKYFVTEIKENSNAINNGDELALIAKLQSKLLNIILLDDLYEAIQQCKIIINETMGTLPLKGNIIYSAEQADNKTDIELVRYAHGGGNNLARRKNGGTVFATIKTTLIQGELSPIHGFTWYNIDNSFLI